MVGHVAGSHRTGVRFSLGPLKKIKKIISDLHPKLRDGFVSGMGWAFGVTIGFVLISTLLVILLHILGGLPVVGKWIADIVTETQIQLSRRSILMR